MSMKLFTEDNLDLWIKLGRNVLFTGKHGVGKTTKVIDAFNRNNLKWMYFSASTMDPWTDFVGVPRVKTDEQGDFLEYILPKLIADDTIEAFFFDEFNRAPKRVRNAVMELIQFKSINGRKLKNLKIVWAARNPEDEEETYDVEKLDPAQADRFPIHCDVPYELDLPYFNKKYGEDWSLACKEWWYALSPQLKDQVSPRKLDDALSYQKDGGDIGHVLPSKTNVSALRIRLLKGSYLSQLSKVLDTENSEAISKWLKVENNWAGVKDQILTKSQNLLYVLEYAPKDKIVQCMREKTEAYNYVLDNFDKKDVFKDVIKSLLAVKTKEKWSKDLAADVLKKYPTNDIVKDEVGKVYSQIKSTMLRTTSERQKFVSNVYALTTHGEGVSGITLKMMSDKMVEGLFKDLVIVAYRSYQGSLDWDSTYWTTFGRVINERSRRYGWDYGVVYEGDLDLSDEFPKKKVEWNKLKNEKITIVAGKSNIPTSTTVKTSSALNATSGTTQVKINTDQLDDALMKYLKL